MPGGRQIPNSHVFRESRGTENRKGHFHLTLLLVAIVVVVDVVVVVLGSVGRRFRFRACVSLRDDSSTTTTTARLTDDLSTMQGQEDDYCQY